MRDDTKSTISNQIRSFLLQIPATMTKSKENLPSKVCSTCKLPFTWRKKWAKTWTDVKYCSERCKRSRPKSSEQSEKQIGT
ncbi:DUF2256 domain-containing protein [Pirellulaceae bacterium SH449]